MIIDAETYRLKEDNYFVDEKEFPITIKSLYWVVKQT